MWSLPEALMVESNFWLSSSDPLKRKQTSPSWNKDGSGSRTLDHMTGMYLDVVADFKTPVREDILFKDLGQPTMLPDVVLETADAIVSNDEPKLEAPEPATEWDSPMLKKHNCLESHNIL